MANNLNQAFIQAFKKSNPTGGAQGAVRGESVDAVDSANRDLVVRLDTATMSIPQPHFHKSAIRAQRSVSAENTTNQAPSVDSSEELRDSIADEMLRASGIGEENGLGVGLGGSSFDTFSSFQSVPSNQPPKQRQPAPSGAIFDPQPNLPIPQERPAIKPASDASNQHRPQQFANAPQAAAPALEPPTEPALSPTEVEQIVESYVRKHGKPGEIIRLDTPVQPSSGIPSDPQEPSQKNAFILEEDLEPLSEHDRIGELEEEALTQPEALTVEPEDPSRAAQKQQGPASATEGNAAAVIEAEENLRRAKMRSFTPVWEVDKLHWPLVCESLIAECQDSLMNVAINLSKASEEGLQVLAVTSPEAGNGRSTVSCCLAQIAGAAGLRVAIVDGDIENPSLSYQTNLDVDQDWKTAVLTEMPLEEVAVHSIEDQVTLIPLVEPIHDFEMDEHDNRIAFMLQQLSESFDLVLVDMGHMDSKRTLVTAMAEQGIISAVLAVVDPQKTTPQKIEACIRRIRRTGITSVGIVENFASSASPDESNLP
ncbi:MAG: tyrosine-protein kinase family protein [Pirellulaceae bacterium]